jgi:soluble lytic murein transglycosylase-like protein
MLRRVLGPLRAGRLILPAVLVALSAAPAAQAEYAVLRSGQRLHVTGYERAGDSYRLHIRGGIVMVAAESVVAIEPEDIFAAVSQPMPDAPFGELIRAAAQRHGLDEHLIASVIAAESNFNPRAVSRRHARGLMQLRPATAAQLGVADVFHPAENIEAGTRYLKELLQRYGDLPLALAAYNAGPERVEQYRGVPPFPETRAYVRRVLAGYQQRREQSPAPRLSAE